MTQVLKTISISSGLKNKIENKLCPSTYFLRQSKYFFFPHGNNYKDQIEENNQNVVTSLD